MKNLCRLVICVLLLAGSNALAQTGAQDKNTMIEIRSYNLKPGTRDAFDKLMSERAMPLLKKWKMEVVNFGPSLIDENSYFLIRSFKSLEDLQKEEDAFYGSDDWRKGPREPILALIENYTTVVLPDSSNGALARKLKAIGAGTNMESDRERLHALNAKFINNFVTNDTASHSQIIHQDFVYIGSDGSIVPRKEYLKSWSHGFDAARDKIDLDHEVIRIFGDMALVRANTSYVSTEKGKLLKEKTVYTDTYIKENGRWWCVQAQITAVQ